jgi:DnaJ homologue, subfamily C, member 28, conserved domain
MSSGRGGRIRTGGPLRPRQVRYQAALRPDSPDYPTGPSRCTIPVMPFERIAELRLRQAIEDGLLDDLPKRGEPLELEEYFATPEDLRLAYSILKNANCLPEEVELRNEIAALERARPRTASSGERGAIDRRIGDLTLRLGLLRDRARRR